MNSSFYDTATSNDFTQEAGDLLAIQPQEVIERPQSPSITIHKGKPVSRNEHPLGAQASPPSGGASPLGPTAAAKQSLSASSQAELIAEGVSSGPLTSPLDEIATDSGFASQISPRARPDRSPPPLMPHVHCFLNSKPVKYCCAGLGQPRLRCCILTCL